MRDEFPIFKAHPNLIYLDTAATSHKPQCVIDALTHFYSSEYGTVHRAIYHSSLKATEKYQQTRLAAARFLNAASPDEIVFTRGTTDGINLVSQSYGNAFLRPGDEVLVSEHEHHSNFVPWQMLCKRTGALLRCIPADERGVLLWEGCINPRTKLVALAHISNVTGTIHPIEAIGAAAKKVGAKFVVDGAQAAPHIPIDVQAIGCDFYAFSGHKCYGPTGIGILYGKKELLDQMPPIQGGGDMVELVDIERSSYREPPLRFEAGTPSIGSVIALKTALEFVEKNRQKEERLLPFAMELLSQIPGLRILGTAPQKGPIITFHVEGIHPLDLATLLDLKKIAIRSGHLCAQPLLRSFGLTQAARVSFGLYNSQSDVEIFADCLRKIVRDLRL